MTYLLAWRSRTTAFIVSDSAVSKNSGRLRFGEYSSFQEPHSVGTQTVEEGYFKLVQAHGGLFGFAGEVYFIHKALRAILDGPDGSIAAIEHQLSGIRFPEKRVVDILYATRGAQGPSVYAWDNTLPKWVETDAAVGGLSPEDGGATFRELVGISSDLARATAEQGHECSLASEEELVVVMSGMQSFMVRVNTAGRLMKSGVGGGVFGGFVDDTGPHWQPEILYLLYDLESFPKTVQRVYEPVAFEAVAESGGAVWAGLHAVSTFVRAETGCTYPFQFRNKQYIKVMNPLRDIDVARVRSQMRAELPALGKFLSGVGFRYCCFIRRNHPHSVIVRQDTGEQSFRIVASEGRERFWIRDDLERLIRIDAPLPDASTNLMYLRPAGSSQRVLQFLGTAEQNGQAILESIDRLFWGPKASKSE